MTAALDDVAYALKFGEYPIHPIHDDAANERALAQLEELSVIKDPSAEESALADILATLIEAYEARYDPEPVSPLDTLLELMAANDLRSKDISQLIGSKGNASDVLHGKRKISVPWLKRLPRASACPTRCFSRDDSHPWETTVNAA